MMKDDVIFPRMVKLYEYMAERSIVADPHHYHEYGVPHRVTHAQVFMGIAREMADELDENKASIDFALTNLHMLDCISKIKRGSAKHPSVFLMQEPPTRERYESYKKQNILIGQFLLPSTEKRNEDAITRLNARINELENRIERLEREQENHAVRDSRRRY